MTTTSFQKLLCTVALGAILTGTATSGAWAQTAAPADTGLGQIVVTAQRKTENAQTTPITVSAFSETALAERRIDSIIDLKTNVPNLVIEYSNINPSGFLAYLRGAGQNGGFVNSENAVGVYIDDIYWPRVTGINMDFPDLKEVEVLRGPQGTLYGRNSMTGAIKFTRMLPTGSTFGNVEASYGSYNEMRIQGAYSTAITQDLAFLVSANAEKNDGYYHDLAYNTTRGANSEYAMRAALAYTGPGPLKASASLSYNNDRNQGVNFQSFNPTTLAPLVPLHNYQSTILAYGYDSEILGDIHLSYDLGPVQLKSITGMIIGKDASQNDAFGGRTDLPSGKYDFAYTFPQVSTENAYSEELQATGKLFDNKLDYIVGFYYFNETPHQVVNFETNFSAASPPAPPLIYLPQTFQLSTTSLAGFVQATYHVTDALSLTAGVRYTAEHKTNSETLQQSATIKNLVAVAAAVDYNATTPKFGIDYKLTPNIFFYGTVSRGFQAGGFSPGSTASPALVVLPYNPEYLMAYEAGAKTEFFDHKLRFNIDYYINKIDGLQLSAVNLATGAFATQNAGSATVQGPEADISFTPIPGLVFFANGDETDGHYDSLNPTSTVATSHANQIPYVSKYQGQLGFDDKIALEKFGLAGDRGYFLLGYDITYRSRYNVAAANPAISEIDPWSVSDAYVGWKSQDQKLSAILSGKNLADRVYYFSGSTSAGLGYRAAGLPREFRFTVKYGF
jgi:iron complex outermembrane receptor protein